MGPIYSEKGNLGLQLPPIENKTIFFCVLNWGIGHATRSIPIIKELLIQENKLILFSDGEAENLLKESFPQLIIHTLPSYKIKYKSKHFLFLTIALQSVSRFWVLRKEYIKLLDFHRKYHADIVISDNRYGCYLPNKKNFLISHQLKLVSTNFIERFTQGFIEKLIKPFDELWIPDIEDVKLSGNMAEVKSAKPKRWIGFPILIPKERLTLKPAVDILILLSGPEPRRSELELIYLKIIPKLQYQVTFIAGNFSKKYHEFQRDNLTYFSFKKYEETIQYIDAANIVVCRSGYSTLIDLYVLGKEKIICVPTAGQPEQEYLATYWSKKGWVKSVSESEVEEKLHSLLLEMV